MNEQLSYIGDFIEIETYIKKETFETSAYTGLESFFSEHLKNTNANEKLKLEGDWFQIKTGDKIILNQSAWSIDFRIQHDLTENKSSYEKEYRVDDIKIEFFTIDPRSDSGLPKIDIKLYLIEI